MNALTAPSDILAGSAPKWQARDDVYQVGQLLGMLVKGDARSRIRTGEIRRLSCSDHLKEIVYRCLGERRKRYESAQELIDALSHPPGRLKAGVLRSLKGAHVAFTGILTRRRDEAVRAARRAGATVHGGPSGKTTVVVRGRPNPLQAAGKEGGIKLMEIKRLREKGHRITLLNETQFWKLAARPRKTKPRQYCLTGCYARASRGAMDSETADAFEKLSREVREGLQDVRTEIREGLQGVRTELRGEFRQGLQDVRTELRAEIREGLQGVRTELSAEIQDVKRHSDVIAESLRGEIRLVAEGVAGLDEKFTLEFRNVREEVREQIGEVKTLLRLSYDDLDRRIRPS